MSELGSRARPALGPEAFLALDFTNDHRCERYQILWKPHRQENQVRRLPV